MLFFTKSAPSRLSPNEALPQTPLGALPLDPTSPLTPGLSLRFISRYARCWGHDFGQLCSFLIPHLNAAFHCILYLVACCCLFCHFILRFCAILLLFLAVLTLKTLSHAPFLFKLYFLYLSNENLQNRIV